MKVKKLRITTIILLIILGLTAILGGWGLIGEPSGSNLTFTPDMLEKTPFDDFLIPGIILFVLIGVMSLIIAGLVFYHVKNYAWFVIFEGAILTVWLTAEVLMGLFYPLYHYPYYTIGILLIIMGFMLKNKDFKKTNVQG